MSSVGLRVGDFVTLAGIVNYNGHKLSPQPKPLSVSSVSNSVPCQKTIRQL